jgi:hypothetical protein
MLEKYAPNVKACSRCGMCIIGEAAMYVLFSSTRAVFDQYVARGRNQIAKAILNGDLEYTKEACGQRLYLPWMQQLPCAVHEDGFENRKARLYR